MSKDPVLQTRHESFKSKMIPFMSNMDKKQDTRARGSLPFSCFDVTAAEASLGFYGDIDLLHHSYSNAMCLHHSVAFNHLIDRRSLSSQRYRCTCRDPFQRPFRKIIIKYNIIYDCRHEFSVI